MSTTASVADYAVLVTVSAFANGQAVRIGTWKLQWIAIAWILVKTVCDHLVSGLEEVIAWAPGFTSTSDRYNSNKFWMLYKERSYR